MANLAGQNRISDIIGAAVKAKRRMSGLSQTELAKIVNKNKYDVSRLETGKSTFSLTVLERFLIELDLEIKVYDKKTGNEL